MSTLLPPLYILKSMHLFQRNMKHQVIAKILKKFSGIFKHFPHLIGHTLGDKKASAFVNKRENIKQKNDKTTLLILD